MTRDSHDCPKCQRSMEAGHIPDMGYGAVIQSAWTPGPPEPRKYVGGIKYNRKALVPMTAWRCTRCGYVELYAEG